MNRIRLSLSQKAKLIYESSKPGFDRASAAKTFGISLPYLTKILKNQSAILNSLNNVMSKNKNISSEEEMPNGYARVYPRVPNSDPTVPDIGLPNNDDTSEENYPLHLMEPITSIKTEECTVS